MGEKKPRPRGGKRKTSKEGGEEREGAQLKGPWHEKFKLGEGLSVGSVKNRPAGPAKGPQKAVYRTSKKKL